MKGKCEDYNLTLSLCVRDRQQLWRMALARALEYENLDQDDIEEMIGPIEDPQLADCLTLLLMPQHVAGTVITGIAITAAHHEEAGEEPCRVTTGKRRTDMARETLNLPLSTN